MSFGKSCIFEKYNQEFIKVISLSKKGRKLFLALFDSRNMPVIHVISMHFYIGRHIS